MTRRQPNGVDTADQGCVARLGGPCAVDAIASVLRRLSRSVQVPTVLGQLLRARPYTLLLLAASLCGPLAPAPLHLSPETPGAQALCWQPAVASEGSPWHQPLRLCNAWLFSTMPGAAYSMTGHATCAPVPLRRRPHPALDRLWLKVGPPRARGRTEHSRMLGGQGGPRHVAVPATGAVPGAAASGRRGGAGHTAPSHGRTDSEEVHRVPQHGPRGGAQGTFLPPIPAQDWVSCKVFPRK